MNHYQYPRLTYTNKIILSVSLGIFLLSSVLRAVGAFSLVNFLGLSAGGVLSGFVWQLITYPFIENQLLSFLFNSLLVWFVGSELESLWGQRLYLRFILILTFSVGVMFTLFEVLFLHGTTAFHTPLFGLNGINIGLLVAYSILYPDRQLSMMMIFPMRAKVFCWILVGIEVYMAIFSGHMVSWAHLLAMGVSFLLIKFQNKSFISRLFNFTFQRASKKKSRSHLHLVSQKEDDSDKPKYWH